MPNLEERLEAVVAQSEVDGSQWHTIVHGDDMTTVQTESGNVPSVAKQLKDVRAEIINGLEDYVGECRQAKADTLQIKSETQIIKNETNTLKGQTKTLRDEAETFKELSQTTYNSIASATAASISQVQSEGAVQVALATAQAERALAYAQNAAPTPLGTKLTVPASSKVPDGYEPVWYKNTITRARYPDFFTQLVDTNSLVLVDEETYDSQVSTYGMCASYVKLDNNTLILPLLVNFARGGTPTQLEPETSQHPDFQIMLMNALKDLSDSGNRQILLTTHTPEIVKMINKEDLIFIQKDHENHMISVETNDDIEISKVADTLGILPFVSYKGVIFVEGKTDIRFLKNLSKIDEFRSIIDLTHFTFIELHGGGNIDLWIKANYLSGTNIKCLYFRDRDTSTTPPSVVHPQKVIITSKREIENYIPISSIEEKFDVTFTPYEIEHWNDMDVANSLYNKGIRFGNDQKHSENVIKQILQGQNIWNQIILSPENRSEIQDWFQQMKDFFEDAGW